MQEERPGVAGRGGIADHEVHRQHPEERDEVQRVDARQAQQQEAHVGACVYTLVQLASMSVREHEAAQHEEEVDGQVLVTEDSVCEPPLKALPDAVGQRVRVEYMRYHHPERGVPAQPRQRGDRS